MENRNNYESNRFKLTFERLPDVEFFCRSITLPSITLPSSRISTPSINFPIAGNKIEYDPITVIYQLDEEWKTWLGLMAWINGFARDDGNPIPKSETSHEEIAHVEILTNDEMPFKSFTFGGIVPTSVESPTLDYSLSDDVLLSVTFDIGSMKLE